jgi:hypothetical protein
MTIFASENVLFSLAYGSFHGTNPAIAAQCQGQANMTI